MESAKGLVKSIDNGVATVTVESAPVCARCSAGKGCGAGLMSGAPTAVELELSVPIATILQPGDTVQLLVSPSWLMRAAFLAYGLPLLCTVLAAGAAWLSGVAVSDLAAAGISLLGLLGGILLSRHLLDRYGLCDRFEPRLDARPGVPGV